MALKPARRGAFAEGDESKGRRTVLVEKLVEALQSGRPTDDQLRACADALGLIIDGGDQYDEDRGIGQGTARQADGSKANLYRERWAKQTYQRFSEDFRKTGQSERDLISTAVKATPEQFAELKKSFAAAAPTPKRR